MSNIVNYDESNLSDDPGRTKIISKRGCKYPERIINHSRSSTSLMFAALGSGELLPCYVVYKAVHLHSSSVAVPYFKKLPKCFFIGDNLTSHLSIESIEECTENNISLNLLTQ